MIIRKLFGPAFAGDKLATKLSPFATRTCDEIHDFIQDGINAGDLDVDGDGYTTALGDGLMVIRRLFGPAFAADKLIDKAISPESPFLDTLPGRWWLPILMPGMKYVHVKQSIPMQFLQIWPLRHRNNDSDASICSRYSTHLYNATTGI